jgi:hypothetical protein
MRQHAGPPATSTLLALHSLIAAMPTDRLRELVLTLMLDRTGAGVSNRTHAVNR